MTTDPAGTPHGSSGSAPSDLLARVLRQAFDDGLRPADARHDPPVESGFELLEVLGRGKFGTVHRAFDRALERIVALKTVHFEDALPPGERSLFLREARTLAKLRHPNIVHVNSIEEHEGAVRICLEHIAGRTLEEIVRSDGPMSAREGAEIGIALCSALSAIHGVGLLHGDLKHSNVMRESGGRIVLLDFGLARFQEGRPAAKLQFLGGTPLFMPPEQLRGEVGDARADLYSLGVLLYWLVCGRFPVEARSSNELADKILAGSFVPLFDRRADVPLAFARLIGRCLAPDREGRPDSAGVFADELSEFLGRERVENGTSRVGQQMQRAGNGPLVRPWIAAAGTLLVAGIAWVLVASPWSNDEARVRSSLDIDFVTLYSIRDGEPVAIDSRNPPADSGDVVLRVAPEADTYLYLFTEDRLGHLTVLFPWPSCAQENPVLGGLVTELPGECRGQRRVYERQTASGGSDKLLLVACDRPQPVVDRIVEAARKEGRQDPIALSDRAAQASLTRGLGVSVAKSIRVSAEPGAAGSTSELGFPWIDWTEQGLRQLGIATWSAVLPSRE